MHTHTQTVLSYSVKHIRMLNEMHAEVTISVFVGFRKTWQGKMVSRQYEGDFGCWFGFGSFICLLGVVVFVQLDNQGSSKTTGSQLYQTKILEKIKLQFSLNSKGISGPYLPDFEQELVEMLDYFDDFQSITYQTSLHF